MLKRGVLPLLFCMASACVFNDVFAADIKVAVDRNPVSLDESFQIIFTAAETPDDDPDFSPLEQDFDIISQSNSSSATWTNGKARKTIQWTLNVMARQAGSLVIPPVKFGRDSSPALPVTVTQGGGSSRLNTDEDIIVEVEAKPQEPYVQSQVLYKVKIYSRVEIARASMNEPELDDAVIEKLGEDASYATQINGVDYSVTERNYALFPQKSGTMSVKPLVLNAEVLAGNPSGLNGFFSSQFTKTQRVSSKAVVLKVRPAPQSFTGSHWLAAGQLELKEQWSGDIRQMKVGEPLTRTLMLQAKGATAGQLPGLNSAQKDDGVKMYPDQPVLKEQKSPEGVIAFRQEKIALIPSRPGDYTLPAIEIPWFNTQKQKMEIAIIPAVTITAFAAAGLEPQATAKAPSGEAASPAASPSASDIAWAGSGFWPWISAGLAVGWLATLIYFLRKRPEKKAAAVHDERSLKEEACIKRLKKACDGNNAAAAKNALIEWGKMMFGATSLGAVAAGSDARLRDEILELNRMLYSQEAPPWQGKKLFQAFSENKARKQLAALDNQGLEPLYRL